jgi:uncharacterized RDD family membrane protein YckC
MATAVASRIGPALDTAVGLTTPERIAFRYPLAGPFRRLGPYLLDSLIISMLIMALFSVSTALAGGSQSGAGPALAGTFAVVWGYGIFCEGVLNGRTAGKKVAGLRVVSDAGVPITMTQAVIRNVVGTVDGPLPFCYLAGLASMALTGKFQRLGDLAAGTMVIVEEGRWRRKLGSPDGPEIRAVLDRMPARIAAGAELARALSDYVQARPQFSDQGREVLAAPLARALIRGHGLPAESSADAVLCAAYRRIFLGD